MTLDERIEAGKVRLLQAAKDFVERRRLLLTSIRDPKLRRSAARDAYLNREGK